jgi:acyl transferase domain-containing protein/aryl carrier-like protein
MSKRARGSRPVENPHPEAAIAIVGAGLRFPGGVRDLASYWELLRSGRDAVVEVPPDRWDVDAWYDPDREAPGKMDVREGGFLEDVATFDAAFFGISPREALELDPAQRLLLMVAWEALESAAIAPDSLESSRSGVYIGLGLSDYGRRHFFGPDPRRMTAYSGTGTFLSVAAGRISYTLGLQGPAMTVDTACSSSLVSVHLAVQALRKGEVELALAGGANLLCSPEPSVYFSKLGALSPSGRCRTFDAAADGYGRGEGAAVIALKRLQDAISAGDRVLAVIRGTAVGQDGRSNGLTAPNGAAQQAVVRAALADAEIHPDEVGYIEAHGTGTPLGDPIEIDALKAVFGKRRKKSPLRVGSVKTNFGHTETAAGVAGLLKVVVAMQHGAIPPHLHLQALNPRIQLEKTPLEVNTELVPWEGERIGGVSSFGLSGTNAHVVLHGVPEPELAAEEARPIELITLSARSEPALQQLAAQMGEALADPAVSLVQAERTMLLGRAQLPVRLAVAGDRAALVERLAAAGRGEDVPGVVRGASKGKHGPSVGFLLTGQGAQYAGMARRLYETEPPFRAALDRCFEVLGPLLGRSLSEVMWQDEHGLLDETTYTQPALFALHVSLASLLRELGVEPDVLLGHSVGEISAAHLAGVLSLQDAAKLVVGRARLMGELPRDGSMLAVFADEPTVRQALADHAGKVDLAAVNGPTEVVISGEKGAISALASRFAEAGVKTRNLTVSHAFHSPLMEPMLDAFEELARSLTYKSPKIEVRSNLDGQSAAERLRDPAYWRAHVRGAVRFADGLLGALEDCELFVELGPRPVLSAMGMRLAEGRGAFLPALTSERDDQEQLSETLGALWARGVPVDLRSRYGSGPRLALPTMPWVGERYWLDPVPPSSTDPLAGELLSLVWRSAPLRRGQATGSWRVVGDRELAAALQRRGAQLGDEGAQHVVYAPTEGTAQSVTAQAIELAQLAVRERARLYLVSCTGSQPETGALMGLGRVLALEHPASWGGWVDLEPGSAEAAADALLDESAPAELARIQHGQRRVLRLVPARGLLAEPPVLSPEGTVLVTGALGGLGPRLVRRLVQRGARHLVLLSRQGAAHPGAAALLSELEGRGVRAELHAVDTSDADALGALVRSLPGLVGVVHAAGSSDDAPLMQHDEARVARVLAGKVEGARLLDVLTADRPLQFFVVISSAAGTLGTAGQAAYAAANAATDALMRSRRAQGRAATSLLYGPWAGPGMADRVDAAAEAAWADQGIVRVEEALALAAFDRALHNPAAELLVAPFDWARWRATRPLPSPLVDELVAESRPAGPADQPVADTALLHTLRQAAPQARRAMLIDHVQQLASQVLGHGPDKRIGTRDGFFDSGMDSMMTLQLRERLQRALGRALSATLTFDHPNVEALAEHLLVLLELGEAPAAPVVQAPAVSSHEPIAIVGVACRLPGGVDDLDSLWSLLEAGGDAITEVPRERFDLARYYDPTPGTPGKTYCRSGGFVDGIDLFEPALFGISPREAQSLDPQQRMLLECTWHALEDAGRAPDGLGETRTGVFVGIGQSEYWYRFDPTRPDTDTYAGTGNETSFAAGRVAYVLGLQGPALSVNTACSSSLVSIHLAVQALRGGQCELAVAGGVNAIVGPETTLWMSMLQALAPDGHCKTFDARADGYVRSEGCGVVVLKRLSDAQRDGDHIYAVIRGSAVGHDGASSGLTVPNGLAQQQVLRQALQDAGVEPQSVGYVECHGTGTRLGDPIEVRALGTVLAAARTPDQPLYLGSIKANLGHLEAGAGVVGLLRALLVVQRGVVPPVAHLAEPNPALPLSEFPAVVLPRRATSWPAEVRRAGVSSFGISGTNAHIVLEQAPARQQPVRSTLRPLHLLALSGRTEAQVQAEAETLAGWLQQHPELPLADVAYTRHVGRAQLGRRAALVARDAASLQLQLAKLAKGAGIGTASTERPRIVFLCTGAGPQALGMARELYETEPVFREALQQAAAAADTVLQQPLLQVIYSDQDEDAAEDSPLHDLAYTQPAMFALEWAMAELWRSWGVQPDAVIGHSTGQFVAACLAGVTGLHEGMRLMAQRAKLMSDEPKIGAMVACFAPEERVAAYLRGHEATVSLAAVNGPAEAVISGRAAVVEELASRIEADGIEVRRLNISHAAHSPMMEPILARFEALVGEASLSAPRLPLVENVRGAMAGQEVTTARYWRDHLRQPVQFARGMRTLVEDGFRIFVEIGNHPVLAGAGARCVEDTPDAVFLPSLRRDRGDWEQLLETAGRLWTLGVPLDWEAFHRRAPGARLPMPGLRFQRKRHWVERQERAPERAVPGQGWLYASRWEPIRPNVDPFGSRGERPLVVLADRAGLAEALAKSQHRRVISVLPGDGYREDGAVITVDPRQPEHLARVLREHQPQHVVHLWSLDAELDPEGSPSEVALEPALGLLALLRAAADHQDLVLWLVTRGACSVSGEAPALAATPLLGLASTAAIELGELSLVRVDLDPAQTPSDSAPQLELVMGSGLREEQLAVRKGAYLVRRMSPTEPKPSEVAIRADGTYLVTGGLGAIGRRVVDWLLERGAGAVVATSRGAEPEKSWHERLVLARADVGERADVERLARELAARGLPPVVGVFHAAGIIGDARLEQLWSDELLPVWKPKLDGTWNLLRAWPELELFVGFSSAASTLGNPGQGSYAAANAFLDGAAEWLRARGKLATSLCWGPWAEGGLATDATSRGWERTGVRLLPPSVAMAVLERQLGSPAPVLVVLDLDWGRWARSMPRVPALVAGLLPASEPDEAITRKRSLQDELAPLPAALRRERLALAVAAQAGEILGTPPEEVDRRTGFFDAGMDSLMAVELANRLKALLQRPLPATLAFDHPNVEVLTDWLLAQLALGEPQVAVPPAQIVSAPALEEPIAVVGLSCRMPGGANDPEAFWQLLRSGRDPMQPVPTERWDLSDWYDPVPGTPGKMYVREAGWIDWELVQGFDTEFFGISPREAESMDPQQRMLLEVSYEALERAGLTTERLAHSRTGVFVGVGSSGYHQRFQRPGGPLYVDAYAGTGALEAFVSGRVAYTLGLHGPNLALNTACSSTLVATHLACQALRTGDAEVALAGGVHLMLSPENFVYVSQIKAVAPDGRCKTFDARADGYGRAEGCGVLVLKRLSDAMRDGDPVLALIRGTSVGHDGPSSGLTVPYGPAQVQVLSQAVARSGLHPHDISYLEAHGTGTVLGDPIEVHAIEEVYTQGRTMDNPLHIGAVKSNVGHLEVAAGAASLVKMALALTYREIPPHLHFQTPNPDLDLAGHALVVDTAPVPWRSPRGPLRAGVSGFGLAGTNVHLVMEEAPPAPAVVHSQSASNASAERPAHLLLLSARSEPALDALCLRYAQLLQGEVDLGDVAYSAATTRIPYEHRAAVTARTPAEAREQLLSGLATRGQAPGRPPKVAWLFSGQGSQSLGMARELYQTWSVFREVIDRCVAVGGPALAAVLLEDDERVHDTTWTQPALFVLELALAALWRSWGVEPQLVAGHSIGQIAAACVAGVFSVEDGLRMVLERGRLMGELPRDGSMAAVFADEATVKGALEGEVAIAAINTPREVTISGRSEAVRQVLASLSARGIEHKMLVVSHAFHSPLMQPMLEAFEATARTVRYSPAKIPVVCNLTGALATDVQLTDPAYWRELVRSPVRFADGLQTLASSGAELFVELGPHTSLLGMGRQTLSDSRLRWLPSLQRGEPAHSRLVPSLGAAFVAGIRIDWAGFDKEWVRQRVALPTYPWQRHKTWLPLEEFPAQKERSSQWLVERRWEPVPSVAGTAIGDWAVLGSSAEAELLRQVLVKLGARVVEDPAAAKAGLVVMPSLPDGLGADPTGPAMVLLDAVQKLGNAQVPLTVVIRQPERPLAGTLLGLARVIRAERPDLQVSTLEVGEAPPEHWMAALTAREREPELRLVDGQLEAARLVRASFEGTSPELGGGAILVTGGTGGIGLATARWLAEHGACELVLVGRREPDAAALAAAEQMRALGAAVRFERGDVADIADVERIVGSIPQLVGVVHSAGVLQDASLARLDAEAFRVVFAPKVVGTWNLHQATAGTALRFFVMFAAGAGLMGSPGQGNYAAANAFQDSFAAWRQAQGLSALSIDWGSWAEVGMAARTRGLSERQQSEGIQPIPLREGLEVFGRLLGRPGPQVGVLPVNWARFVETAHRGQTPRYLERLVPVSAPVAEVSARPATLSGRTLVDELSSSPRAQWNVLAERYVQEAAKQILRMPSDRKLDPEVPLLDMGLDSLLAVELKNVIMDGGVDIPVARVMTGPSVRQIGQMVVTTVEEQGLLGEATDPMRAGQLSTSQLPERAYDPPVNIFVSHFAAFVFGVLLVVGGYVGTTFWMSLQPESPGHPRIESAEDEAPTKSKKR